MSETASDIDIFLSYSSRRRAAAKHLAAALECYGFRVWYDYQLVAGSDFAFQIDTKIRAAKVTLVLWCPLSAASEFVHEELDVAKALGRLMPVMMEDCERIVGTRRLQHHDMTQWDGSIASPLFSNLVETIGARIGRQPRPDRQRQAEVDADWVRQNKPRFSDYEVEAPNQGGRQTPVGTLSKSPSEPHPSPRTAGHSLIQPGKLTIGVFPYPPLTVGQDTDTMSGPWIELASGIADRLGLEPSFRFTSFGDLLRNAYYSVDMVACVFRTDRRQKYFDFTTPVNRIGLAGLCRAELGEIDEDDLRDGKYRILVQEGEVGWEYTQDEARNAVERKQVDSMEAIDPLKVLRLVKAGDYDVALMDALSCENFLRDSSLSAGLRLAFDTPLNMFDSAIAIRRTSGLNVDRVNEIVREVRNSPEYRTSEQLALRGYEKLIRRTSLL